MGANEYLEVVQKAIYGAVKTQEAEIARAADLWTSAIVGGGLVHVFGSGHSSIVCQDVYGRAGGLVPVNWIVGDDLLPFRGMRSAMVERVPGLAAALLEFEPLSPGDALVVVSNSGRNAVPVEVAEVGRQRGLRTIAITSLQHSRSFSSRAPSGKRLFEIVDVVLDNMGIPGDAALTVGRGELAVRVGPTSTVVGAFILQAIVVETVERLLAHGMRPPVFSSANIDTSEDLNVSQLLRMQTLVPSLMASDINRLQHGSHDES